MNEEILAKSLTFSAINSHKWRNAGFVLFEININQVKTTDVYFKKLYVWQPHSKQQIYHHNSR